mmetsp:Transcript_30563/g.98459  ORF Transcript_30563/g.98459 Transcript_30563/m.98459 type:complete len:110 (+) Transcript_30563:1320-1649(+)
MQGCSRPTARERRKLFAQIGDTNVESSMAQRKSKQCLISVSRAGVTRVCMALHSVVRTSDEQCRDQNERARRKSGAEHSYKGRFLGSPPEPIPSVSTIIQSSNQEILMR